MSRSATVPLMLDTATMDPPPPLSIIARATARIVSQVPVRLTSITRFQSAGSCAINIPEAPTPAQATKRSGTPTLAKVCVSAPDTASGSLMSQAMSPPRRSHVTTSWPAPRNRSAAALPMPEAPPVTMAVTARARSAQRGRRPVP